MAEAPKEESEDSTDSEILILVRDLAEVIDILHNEVSEMKKVLKIVKTDVEEIKGTKHSPSNNYMHG